MRLSSRFYWWRRSLWHRWNLWRLHRLLMVVIILECPAALWMQIPSQERDRITNESILDYCYKEAQKGARKFIISQRFHKYDFQLDVEIVERSL